MLLPSRFNGAVGITRSPFSISSALMDSKRERSLYSYSSFGTVLGGVFQLMKMGLFLGHLCALVGWWDWSERFDGFVVSGIDGDRSATRKNWDSRCSYRDSDS